MSNNGTALEQLPEVKAADDERWQFAIKFVNRGQKNAFARDYNHAMESGDTSAFHVWLARFVKAWSFVQESYEGAENVGQPLDPSKVEDYDKLTDKQFDDLIERFGVALHTFRKQAV